VYACAPGKLWSDSAGARASTRRPTAARPDAGAQGSEPLDGCASLAMDPKNPDHLFAGMWDFRRKGWTFRSGGESPDAASGSGLFESQDGGKTWTELTDKTSASLPAKPWGRVEVAVAPSDPKIVYALIESAKSALYRSADGGKTWEARDRSQMMVWRPFYFGRLVVDPVNADRVLKPGGGLIVSEDGGRSFAGTGGGAHGDWHDVWIDPDNPKHVIGGDDGGLWVSYDGGNRWWKSENLPISQFYHVPWTRGTRTRCTEDCRTTARGSATPRTPAASRTRAGRTSTAATGSGRSPIRPIPTPCTRSHRAATSARWTARRTRRATSSPRPATRRSCASTGTRRSSRARTRRGRSTWARSSSSARATRATRGSASRRTSRPTTRRSRSRSSPAA
jgi:hypothetical protein